MHLLAVGRDEVHAEEGEQHAVDKEMQVQRLVDLELLVEGGGLG